MKYRQLGKTGLQVSEIGYGAWGIGQSEWVGADDQVSLQALQAARHAGINFFDTALAYGTGHSEQLLARAFGRSQEVIIASKVPPKNFIWPAQPGVPLRDVFPRPYVLSCLERTLRNLGRESVDLYQFHVWNDEWAGDEEWLATARQIRESGKARFLGISINDHQPANSLRALATGLIDAVQVIYNLFDQSPDDELLPYCQKHQIGVLARVPFDEGSLTGKIRPDTTFPPDDFRNQYFGGSRKRQVWGTSAATGPRCRYFSRRTAAIRAALLPQPPRRVHRHSRHARARPRRLQRRCFGRRLPLPCPSSQAPPPSLGSQLLRLEVCFGRRSAAR